MEIGKRPKNVDALELLDENGETVSFNDLLGGRPLVVVLLRHFACMGCSEHVVTWLPRLGELQQLGFRVVFAGNGEARYIQGFMERLGLKDKPVEVLSDPSLTLYQAAALERSLWSTFGFRSMWNGLRALGGGHFQVKIEGDPLQQGGVLIFDGEGILRFRHAERAIGDYLDVSDVLNEAAKLVTK